MMSFNVVAIARQFCALVFVVTLVGLFVGFLCLGVMRETHSSSSSSFHDSSAVKSVMSGSVLLKCLVLISVRSRPIFKLKSVFACSDKPNANTPIVNACPMLSLISRSFIFVTLVFVCMSLSLEFFINHKLSSQLFETLSSGGSVTIPC